MTGLLAYDIPIKNVQIDGLCFVYNVWVDSHTFQSRCRSVSSCCHQHKSSPLPSCWWPFLDNMSKSASGCCSPQSTWVDRDGFKHHHCCQAHFRKKYYLSWWEFSHWRWRSTGSLAGCHFHWRDWLAVIYVQVGGICVYFTFGRKGNWGWQQIAHSYRAENWFGNILVDARTATDLVHHYHIQYSISHRFKCHFSCRKMPSNSSSEM